MTTDPAERGVALIFTLAIVTILSGVILAFLITMKQDRQQSFSYSQSIKANELALGALQQITGNLQREIDAGSTVTVSGSRAVYTPLSNKTAAPAHLGFADSDYAVEIKADKLPRTVLQVSRDADDDDAAYDAQDYPGTLPVNCASAVSSTTPSANGRVVSATRWNKPLFMSGSQASVPLPFANNPPQWVYFTRAGSRLCTDAEVRSGTLALSVLSNTSAVLGRYAYVIYDESALLDVNVAGYVYSTTAAYRDELRGKQYLAYADLTKIPGLTVSGVVEDFVKWRNKGGLRVSGDNYAKMVTNSATTGFLQFTGTDGEYDNPLLGRQDLIDYLNKVTLSGSAAPYLTTFSRAIAAPSWGPTFDASRPVPPLPAGSLPSNTALPYGVKSKDEYEYKRNADSEKVGPNYVVNRNLANVRHTGKGGVEHYDDTGARKTYNVKAGDPLMVSRFSLRRIDWLANDPNSGAGPNSNYETAVLKCFGLKWGYPGGNSSTAVNGGNRCWNYVGSDDSGYPGKIKTLAEVADERREPNFFELLKAAILNGSLGRAPGPATFNNGKGTSYMFGTGSGPASLYCLNLDPLAPNSVVPAPAQIPDLQIIQIGANIIDQWDADSYPTAIYFKYDGVGNYDSVTSSMTPAHFFGPVTMVYGNENLPYLSRVAELRITTNRSGPWTTPGQAPIDLPNNPNDRATNTMGGWIQPEVWNPHQEMTAAIGDPVPRHFQIRAYGRAYVQWSQTGPEGAHTWVNGESDPTQKAWYEGNDPDEHNATGTIDLYDNHPTLASSFYSTPFMVRNEKGSGSGYQYYYVTATSADPLNHAQDSYPYFNKIQSKDKNATTFSNTFVAFSTGTTDPEDSGMAPYRPFWLKEKNTGVDKINVRFKSRLADAVSFAMGWVDSSGKFHPYSFITGIFPWYYSSTEGWDASLGHGNPLFSKSKRWLNMEPRTSRFGTAYPSEDSSECINNLLPYGWNGMESKGLHKQGKGALPQDPAYGFPSFTSVGSDKAFQNFMINFPVLQPNQTNFSATRYYRDPDGIIRPGDGYYADESTGDGMIFSGFKGNPTGLKPAAGDKNIPAPDATGMPLASAQHGRRPLILNRPFRSVGELGYVYRDLPYKTLDFFTAYSADAALLDVFCLADEVRVANSELSNMVAGQFNPTNAPRQVTEAVLAGAGKKNLDPNYNLGVTDGKAAAMPASAQIAQNIAAYYATGTNGGMLNRAELVTVLSGTIRAGYYLSSDLGNKAYAEAPVRALAGAVQTRTWNVMIDVIAQTGRLSPSADKLEDFIVEGERRYWLHLAIDRYTGKIIDQQLEPVYE